MNGKIMLNGKAYSSSGRPSREITYAQWLALPDTKYTDGIVYYIKDIGGANAFPPLIYSAEEREVGVWIDGKPIYLKVLRNADGSALPQDNDVTDLHIDKLIETEGLTSDYSDRTYPRGLITASSGLNSREIYMPNANTVRRKGSYYCFEIVLLYTKTTDSPGSGTWTNDGTYAKHYSTTEKVIGTWIDGKPIYERTDTFTNSSGISGEVNLMAIDSTWRLIDAKVHVYNSSNQRTYFFPYMTSAYDSIMVSNGYLKLVSNDSWGSAYSPFYITIQYTKTTD